VKLTGSATATTTANGSGVYSFTVTNGSYTVTPTKNGHTYSPANKSTTVNGANVTGLNFSST
jgi:outer membrane lipoprotein-sorting protein